MNSRITELEPELRVPENNVIERNFSKIFYWAKKITAESKNRSVKAEKGKEKPERSLLQRRKRKEILDVLRGIRAPRIALLKEYKAQISALPKSETESREALKREYEKKREKLIASEQEYDSTKVSLRAETKERDRIATEYLHQFELSVDLAELGEQQARFTVLEPPKEKAEQKNLPPIFLIPGISNDIDPVGALAQELAISGRRVIVIGYPEASLGRVSEGFAQAISEKPGFEPHAVFFEEAMKAIARQQGLTTYEVWSHSTGGPILANILEDSQMQDSIKNSIFISPAAAKKQSMLEFGKGLLKEIGLALKQYEFLSKYSLVPPGVGGDKEQNKLKKKVNSALIKAILSEYPNWQDVSTGQGSKTLFWSGKKDSITKTAQNTLIGSGIHQDLVENDEGTHLTALVKPEIVIAEIDKKMGRV